MRAKLIFLSILVLTFFCFVAICQAQDSNKRFSLKLTAGYGSMAVGDINAVLEGRENIYTDYASLVGAQKEGEFKELNRGFEYEGELLINITESFGLGIGAGYIQREEHGEASFKHEEDDYYFLLSYSYGPEISAIPVKLTAYYFVPIASRLSLYLNGGIGYYFGKIRYPIQEEYQYGYDEHEVYDHIITAKDNAFGYHGGIGCEYNVTKNLAIFVEGAARYAKLKDWKGDEIIRYSDTYYGEEARVNSGILWYYEFLWREQYYSFLDIIAEEHLYHVRNVRKAEGDFSGFSLRAGIKIIF